MYTQCPSCQTIFEVSAEHLKAANGDVRCGQCLNVFNALNHLSEAVPSRKEMYSSDEVFQENETNSVVDEPAQASSVEDDHGLTDFFSDVLDDSSVFTEVDFEARRKKEKSIGPEGGFFYGGANESIIEKILTEQEPEERELAEFTLPSAPESASGEKETQAGQTGDNSQSPTDIPPQLLDDLQAGHLAEAKATSSKYWLTGSIALMLVLIIQAIYYSRHDLARNPAYQPALVQACEALGCSIDVIYDIEQIEVIGRDVRSHPSADNALIAGTTLINNARFTQPYPLLHLTFSDITGTTRAQRRFTPREYLKSGTDIDAGMSPDLPVQVELELVDPGKDAVNFEFDVESDPRAVTPRQG